MGILKTTLSGVSAVLLLSACQSFDLQGRDPQEYYAAHPIENKVETRHAVIIPEFTGTKFLPMGANAIATSLGNINPHAVDSIRIVVPAGVKYKSQYVVAIKKELQKSGFDMPVTVISEDTLSGDKILIDVAYAAVVSPDCPDWKKSPVTTYSNMVPSNYGCAATVNLGLMVDNPRDLIKGRESGQNNSERATKALSDYRAGVAAAAAPIGQ